MAITDPGTFAFKTQAQKDAMTSGTPETPTLGSINQASGQIEQKFGLQDQSLQRLGTPDQTITSESLTPQADLAGAVQEPTPTQTTNVSGLDATAPTIPEVPQQQLGEQGQRAQAEANRLLGLNEQTLGEAEFRAQQEEAFGLTPEVFQAQTDLSSRLKALQNEAKAIPLQLQQESQGRGITAAGLQPIQTARLRTNAIAALGVSSLLEATRGNIQLAQDLADRAVAQKFDPIKNEIAVASANLDIIQQSPAFTLEEKNQALAQQAAQEARLRAIENQEADAKRISSMALTAVEFGLTDPDTINRIQNASTPEEALALAAPFLQDPVAKVKLQNALLDTQIKKQTLSDNRLKASLLQKYGGLTPTEWAAQKEEEQKALTAAGEKIDAATRELADIDEMEAQIALITDSNALDTVVGPTFLTRGIGRQKKGFTGKAVKAVSTIPTLATGTGVIDEISGGADDIVALTEQLVSQQFLDKLIESKGKGATFGALSDREGNKLSAAANAIGHASIEKDGKVIGYDMSENEFRRQFEIIQNSLNAHREDLNAQKATAQGSVLPEGDPTLDLINASFNGGFDASF